MISKMKVCRPSRLRHKRVQREVQLEDVDAGVSKNSEIPTSCVLLNQPTQLLLAQTAKLGHAWRLQLRIAQANMWVKTAARRGHGVGWHGLVLVQPVLLPIRCHALFDGIIQFLRSRAEIAPAGVRGVVAVAGGGRPRMEILFT